MSNKANHHTTAIEGQSLNITEYNIEQLKQLFPSIFTEGKIDFSALKSELGEHIETSDERYQFTWAGKEQAKRMATTPTLGTLRPAPEESVDWDSTENLYIEGDNLEVLKLLQKSYFKQVKMIYIDPPYNTGKDFVYKDDFKDNLANYQRLTGQRDEEGNPLFTNSDTTGRYHSNWLNMMYPRLKLARNLLRDDGVIFISIDDNEVHNLRKICDEIFGEGNFEALACWRRRHNQPNDKSKMVAKVAENILIYSKNSSVLSKKKTYYGVPVSEDRLSDYKNPDSDPKGDWTTNPWKAAVGRGGSRYEIITPTGKKFNEVWYGSKESFEELKLEGRVYWTDGGGGLPRIKIYREEAIKNGQPAINFLTHEKYGSNQDGSAELASLMLTSGLFDNPKPISLIGALLRIGTLDDDIVIDFFSGSATTAHSVMRLNAEDGGNRKFIMVQIPEPTPEKSEARKAGYETIAEIGKERIRRAAAKIREEHPDTQVDLGFKVLKLDTSNVKKWQLTVETLTDDLFDAVDNIEEGRTPTDLLYEVLLKYGLSLTLPVEELKLGEHTVFNVAMGSLVACFDENITLETVQAIIDLATADTPVLRVVFRDNGFKDDIVKTNAIQRLKQAGIEDVLSI